jgi:hypothetical protein
MGLHFCEFVNSVVAHSREIYFLIDTKTSQNPPFVAIKK